MVQCGLVRYSDAWCTVLLGSDMLYGKVCVVWGCVVSRGILQLV